VKDEEFKHNADLFIRYLTHMKKPRSCIFETDPQ